MRTLRIEMHRAHAWQLRAEGKIPDEITAEQVTRDLQEYAVQFPHRALLDGVEVARVGNVAAEARSAFDELARRKEALSDH